VPAREVELRKPANDRRATSPKRSPKSRRLLGRIVFAAHWLILVALVAGTLLAAVPLDHLEVIKGGTHVRFPQAGPDPAHRAPVELPHHCRGGVRASEVKRSAQVGPLRRENLLLRVPLPDVVAMQTRQPNLEGPGRSRCADW